MAETGPTGRVYGITPELYAQLTPSERAWVNLIEEEWGKRHGGTGKAERMARVFLKVRLTPEEERKALAKGLAEKAIRLGVVDEFVEAFQDALSED